MSRRQSRSGPTAADWPAESLADSSSYGDRRTSIRGEGVNTGVRVMDDGRLDIRFRGEKTTLANLLQRVHKRMRPTPETVRKASLPQPPVKEPEHFPLRLNIVIQVVGSRGDVQPFLAIGVALKERGHRVRLATHLAFRDFVQDHGLEFFNIGGDPAELMAFMVKNPGLMPGVQTVRSGALRRRRREMATIFAGCWRSCFETGDGTGLHHVPENPWSEEIDYRQKPFVADAIIANPPSFAHLSCAEKLGVPLVMMFTMPWTPTQAFPHPLANIRSTNTKPSVANFASYAIVEMMMWEGLGDLINKFRKRDLGLDSLDAIRAPGITQKLHIPFSYLWSPALLPKPADWLDNIDVCGFSMLPRPPNYSPEEELVKFLDRGPPPIYVGFGSIVVDNPTKLTKIIFDAIVQTGQRALVNKGWGNIGAGEAEIPENVFMVGSCPHDWLFQHVSCVVHHGGAGTTASGLALGRPTIIVPFFGDQPFWGSIVYRAGAGPAPIPHKQLTAEKLADAIKKALEPGIQKKASEVGQKMRQENGVKCAVASFHRHLDLNALRCSICPNRPAVWWVRHSHIKLSTFAATVLVEAGMIKPQNVVLYRSKEYDTNRDPRGPISAGAEVLYGVLSDFVSGFTNAPFEVAEAISRHHHHHKKHGYRHDHEEGLNVNCDCASRRTRTKQSPQEIPPEDRVRSQLGSVVNIDPSQSEFHLSASTGNLEDDLADDSADEMNWAMHDHISEGMGEEMDEVSEGSESESYASAADHLSSDESASNATSAIRSDSDDYGEDLEKTVTHHRGRETHGVRVLLDETSYHGERMGKHLLDLILLIPTDLTLSFSKGFHNAPRIYHDRTVKPIPTVMGVRSGLRAAGLEFTQEFYQAVTGLVTQPAQGFKKSGGVGLIKGVGKGLWGLAGYPLDGVHKSLRNSLSKSKTKDILNSRIQQGIDEMCASSPDERVMVIRRWRELQEIEGEQRNGHAAGSTNGHAG
ncbi:putative UDP-glucose,sterol transferase [Aspergillus clavatus NRRL 1]|uniref:Glycosyltransferase family 28 N-terminal domain protein n=1 Tax=Aspergillus clavatus (strain ATCC 1007 / CBS 513.65 / DSM 816 / NCTC 3887 / NRRL 1 / QM 1276 / 107) TaxID=344612 RepID=A1C4F4_ASPCL|nr:glycosyltransferase family 28 N-terminal domain protein [Aspergillus clavatus NRRL 1]EAW15294.1 glycosyltransferase family 28 N-terminal domain protein [Aspergillus clavatus NRRL 1]